MSRRAAPERAGTPGPGANGGFEHRPRRRGVKRSVQHAVKNGSGRLGTLWRSSEGGKIGGGNGVGKFR